MLRIAWIDGNAPSCSKNGSASSRTASESFASSMLTADRFGVVRFVLFIAEGAARACCGF